MEKSMADDGSTKIDALTNKTVDGLGIDDLVEDLFGINLRGLSTIWILIRRPWLYFEAAKTPKWQDRYTPSLRVWFAVFAIGTFFQFVWIGGNSPLFLQYVEVMKDLAEGANASFAENGEMIDMNVFDPNETAKILVKYSQLFLPLGYLICMFIVAALFHSWGERLSFVVRLRYVFAIIIPGSILGFVFAIATIRTPAEIFQYVNLGGVLLMTISYSIVAYFGPFRGMETGVRLGRSFGITTLILIAVLIASFISISLAFIPTLIIGFPEPVPLVR